MSIDTSDEEWMDDMPPPPPPPPPPVGEWDSSDEEDEEEEELDELDVPLPPTPSTPSAHDRSDVAPPTPPVIGDDNGFSSDSSDDELDAPLPPTPPSAAEPQTATPQQGERVHRYQDGDNDDDKDDEQVEQDDEDDEEEEEDDEADAPLPALPSSSDGLHIESKKAANSAPGVIVNRSSRLSTDGSLYPPGTTLGLEVTSDYRATFQKSSSALSLLSTGSATSSTSTSSTTSNSYTSASSDDQTNHRSSKRASRSSMGKDFESKSNLFKFLGRTTSRSAHSSSMEEIERNVSIPKMSATSPKFARHANGAFGLTSVDEGDLDPTATETAEEYRRKWIKPSSKDAVKHLLPLQYDSDIDLSLHEHVLELQLINQLHQNAQLDRDLRLYIDKIKEVHRIEQTETDVMPNTTAAASSSSSSTAGAHANDPSASSSSSSSSSAVVSAAASSANEGDAATTADDVVGEEPPARPGPGGMRRTSSIKLGVAGTSVGASAGAHPVTLFTLSTPEEEEGEGASTGLDTPSDSQETEAMYRMTNVVSPISLEDVGKRPSLKRGASSSSFGSLSALNPAAIDQALAAVGSGDDHSSPGADGSSGQRRGSGGTGKPPLYKGSSAASFSSELAALHGNGGHGNGSGAGNGMDTRAMSPNSSVGSSDGSGTEDPLGPSPIAEFRSHSGTRSTRFVRYDDEDDDDDEQNYELERSLFEAATIQDLSLFASMLGDDEYEYIDINWPNPDMHFFTVLHMVSSVGNLEMLRLLLEWDAERDPTTDEPLNLNVADDEGRTPIMHACIHNFTDIVATLVDAGANIDLVDMYYRSAMHYACLRGTSSCVQLLLDSGAHIHTKDYMFMSPLHVACQFGRLRSVKMLARAASQRYAVEPTDLDKLTPLHYAAYVGSFAACQEILRIAPDAARSKDALGYTPVHALAMTPNSMLLETTAKHLITSAVDLLTTTAQGHTPLVVAVRSHNFAFVDMLIHTMRKDFGGDEGVLEMVNKPDRKSRNALYHAVVANAPPDVCLSILRNGALIDPKLLGVAATKGHHHLCQLLLDNGAKLGVKDGRGWTEIMHAVHRGRYAALLVMLKWDSENTTGNRLFKRDHDLLDMKDSKGSTALMKACAVHTKCATLLVRCGARVDLIDDAGQSALHRAVCKRNGKCVEMLLRLGQANVNLKDHAGVTPLHEASRLGYTEILTLLLEYKAELDVKDLDGQSPLHGAVYWNQLECVRALLEMGANPNARDSEGNTPMHLAALRNAEQCAQYLFMRGAKLRKNGHGRSPMDMAQDYKNTSMVELLERLADSKAPAYVDENIFSGFLEKRRGGMMSSVNVWKRRFFVLRANRLFYFEHETESEHRAVMFLNDLYVREDELGSCAFSILTPWKQWDVVADNLDNKKEWIKQLRMASASPVSSEEEFEARRGTNKSLFKKDHGQQETPFADLDEQEEVEPHSAQQYPTLWAFDVGKSHMQRAWDTDTQGPQLVKDFDVYREQSLQAALDFCRKPASPGNVSAQLDALVEQMVIADIELDE